MLFKKAPREGSYKFRLEMAKKIARKRVRYVCERLPGEDTDLVIGREGGFNIKDNEFILFADNKVLFRTAIADLTASELMSLEGAILNGPDIEHGGKIRTVIAYYVYYI